MISRRINYVMAIIPLITLTGMAPYATVRANEPVPAQVENGWNRTLFDYQRPRTLQVEQTTPTEAQVNFWLRPPQATGEEPEPQMTSPAVPRAVGNIDVVHLRFKDATGDIVPALLCTPKGKPGPFPLVIAIHGLTSNKSQVCGQVAPALIKHGYAVLAADLPCHGERPGNPFDMVDGAHWRKTFPLYRKAAIDVRQLIDLSEQLPPIGHNAPVAVAGYSLGSWVASVVGPCDDRIRKMVLMVGGADELPADTLKNPEVAAVDPRWRFRISPDARCCSLMAEPMESCCRNGADACTPHVRNRKSKSGMTAAISCPPKPTNRRPIGSRSGEVTEERSTEKQYFSLSSYPCPSDFHPWRHCICICTFIPPCVARPRRRRPRAESLASPRQPGAIEARCGWFPAAGG